MSGRDEYETWRYKQIINALELGLEAEHKHVNGLEAKLSKASSEIDNLRVKLEKEQLDNDELRLRLAEAWELLCPEKDLMGNRTEEWLERRAFLGALLGGSE